MHSSDYSSVNGRIMLWDYALDMFYEKPVLGMGLGSYNIYNYAQGTGQLQFAHNQYLQFLAETGLIGCAVLLIIFICCVRLSFLAVKNAIISQHPKNKHIAIFLFMTQIALFIYGITGYPLYIFHQFYLFVITVLCSFVVLQNSTRQLRK